MKNSNETIGNRTHDFSICSAVFQPTVPLRAPDIRMSCINIYTIHTQHFRGAQQDRTVLRHHETAFPYHGSTEHV
jgi:hypothetical protein